jgi:hypothetical protein
MGVLVGAFLGRGGEGAAELAAGSIVEHQANWPRSGHSTIT